MAASLFAALSRRAGRIGAALVLGFAIYLILTPLVALVYSSLNGSQTGLSFTGAPVSLANFAHVLRSTAAVAVVLNSALYSLGTVVLSLVLTVALAYLLDRSDLPARGTLRTVILGPLGIPPIVLAVAWLLLGNPSNGLLDAVGARLNVMTLPGMVFVTSMVMVPSMYLMLSGQLARLDPSLEQAAAVAGVGFLQRTLRITLALLKPVLIGAAVFFLVISLEAFDVAAILGVPKNIYVFSTVIYEEITAGGIPQYGIASAYGVVLVAVSLLLIAWYRRVTRGEDRFRVVTGKGYRASRVKLGRWTLPALAFVLLIAVLGSIAPLLVLLWASLLPFYAGLRQNLAAHLTLTNYVRLFASPDLASAAWHTLVIAVVASTVTVLIAAWAAWAAQRGRFRSTRVIIEGSFIVLGVPGVVVAIALLFWYLVLPRLSIPVHLYGTVWILAIAYITRFLAYAGRLMDSAIRQIDRDLEDAAYVCGVPPHIVVRRVVWPLLKPAMIRGWLWVAVHVVREIPIAALLVTAASETLSSALWQSWSTSTTIASVSAFAVVLTLISMFGTWLMSRFFATGDGDVAVGL